MAPETGREALRRLALRAVAFSPAQLVKDDAVDAAIACGEILSISASDAVAIVRYRSGGPC